MQVSELMNRELITVSPDDSVEEAVTLLHRQGVRHLLVMRKDRLEGIISDRDIKRALDPQSTRKKIMGLGGLYFLLEPILVNEIMTREPVTIPLDTSANHAAWIMVERRFGALPVVDNGKVVGIITETDLLRFFAEMATDPAPKKRAAPPARKPRPKRR